MISKILVELDLDILIPELDQLVKNQFSVTEMFMENLYNLLNEKQKDIIKIKHCKQDTLKLESKENFELLKQSPIEEHKDPNQTSSTPPKSTSNPIEEHKSILKPPSTPSKPQFPAKQHPIPQSLSTSPLHQVKIKSIEVKPLKISVKDLRKRMGL